MKISRHAKIRWQQLAMNDEVVSFISDNFDAEIYLGDGTWAWRVSDRFASELLEADELPASKEVIEKARGTAILFGDIDGGALITMVKSPERTGFDAYTRRPKGRVQRRSGSSRARRRRGRRVRFVL